MSRRATGLGAIIALVIASLVVLGSTFSSAIAYYKYSCNFTFVVQGDISNLSRINQIIVFPNTTRQSVFIEEAKGVVDDAEYRGSLVLDEQGNVMLVFDFPDIAKGQSVVTICVKATIIQRASGGSVPMDELRRVLPSEVPSSLAERYAGNSTSWPVSSTIYGLALNLTKGREEAYYDLLDAFSKWIEENVAYPLEPSERGLIGPQYPDETYESRVGDCDDRSLLFTAMCRAVGIPSFLQVGGIPKPASQFYEAKYGGNYVYRSKGIAWHAWSMVYVPRVGWIPVDTTYFDGAVIERASNGLCYVKSPRGLEPKVTSSAYFIASPIIYANYTSLKYVEEVRVWEEAVKEGRVKVVCVEELEGLTARVPLPIEVPLILSAIFVAVLLFVYFRLKRRQGFLKKA
jgi:transglutaminase-like putative cysteine protease